VAICGSGAWGLGSGTETAGAVWDLVKSGVFGSGLSSLGSGTATAGATVHSVTSGILGSGLSSWGTGTETAWVVSGSVTSGAAWGLGVGAIVGSSNLGDALSVTELVSAVDEARS
jgi:hypothetical protein